MLIIMIYYLRLTTTHVNTRGRLYYAMTDLISQSEYITIYKLHLSRLNALALRLSVIVNRDIDDLTAFADAITRYARKRRACVPAP